jgi:Cu-Zn family superoxide dismutase
MIAMGGVLAWACSDSASNPATDNADSGATNTSSGTSGTSSGTSGTSSGTSGNTPTQLVAKAEIRPTSDASTVQGTAEFVENGSVTVVTVNIASSGGSPGEHGLHIHEKGSCDPVDGGPGLGAGGHWNPADAGHGYPSSEGHHVGDLGNIVIDDAGAGTSKLTFPATKMHVHDGPLSVVGKAIVFHAQRDDGVSQPVGNAGGRPGCGVIEKQ